MNIPFHNNLVYRQRSHNAAITVKTNTSSVVTLLPLD